MRALSFTSPGAAEVLEREPPVAAEGSALVAPRYIGLCGTDLELYSGTMPYFALGVARHPVQPGHEVSGIVVESPSGGPAPGTRVVVDPVVGCLACPACAAGRQTHCEDRFELGVRRGLPGGACELVAVPAGNLHVVPAGVGLRDAVLVEPGVTACHAVDRLGDAAGRRALVLGGGTVGLIATQLLIGAGAAVDVVEVVKERHGLIEQIGGSPLAAPAGGAYDLVVEASGAARAVHDAVASVASGGTIALVGVQGRPVDHVDVDLLVLKDATMFGVLNGPGLFDELLTRIAAGSFDPAPLVDAVFPLGDALAALDRMRQPGRSRPKVLLTTES